MSFFVPKYRLHRGSGQALVQIGGRRVCLEKYGSAKSKEKYRRLVAEALTRQNIPAATQFPSLANGSLSVKEVTFEHFHCLLLEGRVASVSGVLGPQVQSARDFSLERLGVTANRWWAIGHELPAR